MEPRTNKKIIAITKTLIFLVQYYNAEIAKYFHNYNIHRADRDTKYNPRDYYQLLSGGGCMLLTSPDIVTQPVLNFSNGNCKLLITEYTQLKTIIVTVYRLPVPNFALNKFFEVLDRIQQYLTQKEDKESVSIILTGDFNLTPRVVEWVNIV